MPSSCPSGEVRPQCQPHSGIFGTSGSEAQLESSVGRSGEGNEKNEDRIEEQGGGLWERKMENTERGKGNGG